MPRKPKPLPPLPPAEAQDVLNGIVATIAADVRQLADRVQRNVADADDRRALQGYARAIVDVLKVELGQDLRDLTDEQLTEILRKASQHPKATAPATTTVTS